MKSIAERIFRTRSSRRTLAGALTIDSLDLYAENERSVLTRSIDVPDGLSDSLQDDGFGDLADDRVAAPDDVAVGVDERLEVPEHDVVAPVEVVAPVRGR